MDEIQTINEEGTKIEAKYLTLYLCFDERSRRIWAAAEASAYGSGGISLVSKAIGISRSTIYRG
jgi:hypothetical protein